MATPSQAQQFFKYSPKPYDSYFQGQGRGQAVAPPQPVSNPYGQIGNERLKLESQFRVNELLGQMDAVEQNKRDRNFFLQNQAAIEAARQQQLNNELEALGQKQRQQDVMRRMQGIDWTNPNSRTQLSALALESPEAAEIVADQARMQERIFGGDLLGQRKLKEQEEAAQYKLAADPRYIADVESVVGKGGTAEQAKALVLAKQQDAQVAARMAKYGMPVKEIDSLRRPDGFIDPIKAGEAEAAMRRALMEQKAKAVKPLTQPQILSIQKQKLKAESELNDLGTPTDKAKVDAFTAATGKPPTTPEEWDAAFELAQRNDPERKRILKDIAIADQALAGGQPQAPAAEAVKQEAQIPVINSQAEYDKLPKGTRYKDSHGKMATKK